MNWKETNSVVKLMLVLIKNQNEPRNFSRFGWPDEAISQRARKEKMTISWDRSSLIWMNAGEKWDRRNTSNIFGNLEMGEHEMKSPEGKPGEKLGSPCYNGHDNGFVIVQRSQHGPIVSRSVNDLFGTSKLYHRFDESSFLPLDAIFWIIIANATRSSK
jgi:hypothetical protein